MNSTELAEILTQFNKASDEFYKARITLMNLRTEERRLEYYREILENELADAINSMIKANRLIINSIKGE